MAENRFQHGLKNSRRCLNRLQVFLGKSLQVPPNEVAAHLNREFSIIMSKSFGIAESTDLEAAVEQIRNIQLRARQREFPLLERLTPKRNLDTEALSLLSTVRYQEATEALLASIANFLTAIESNESISDAQRAISRSLDVLRTAGLIRDEELQHCPLCEFEDFETLSKARIEEVSALESSTQDTFNRKEGL